MMFSPSLWFAIVHFALPSDSPRCNTLWLICEFFKSQVLLLIKARRENLMQNASSRLRPVPRSILAFVFVLVCQMVVFAQTNDSGMPTETRVPSTTKIGSDFDEKLRNLQEVLNEQARQLEDLRTTIANQQRVIEALTAKVIPGEGKIGEPKDIAAVPTAPAAQNQTPSLEDRVKKVESKVTQLGPFRLSGDFRLLFDAILRTAEPAPPAGFTALTHQQNLRIRYHLRLNADTGINS